MYRRGMEEMMVTQQIERHVVVAKEVVCEVCRRKFSREGDRRRKLVREKRGSVQCVTCKKRFLSKAVPHL